MLRTSRPVGRTSRVSVGVVADLKPPRLVGGSERATLRTLMQYQRESVVRKLDGLTDDDARRPLVPSGTSLLWIVKHLTRAELLWIVHRFAGRSDVALPSDQLEPDESVASVLDGYRSVWMIVDEIVDAASLDQPCRDVGSESMVDLRWVLMHLLEETARHAGHADIIREQIDGTTGR